MGAASAEFWRTEPGYAGRQWRDLVPLMRSRVIDPPIGSVFALDQAAAALREIDQRRAAGRVLLRVREPMAREAARHVDGSGPR
jgi:NADPH2:quinone reductase